MAFVVNDRVKETSTTTGTGTLSLAGAVSGFQTFVAGIGNSNVTYYAIVNDSGTEFEIGIGTVTDASPDTLSRTTILTLTQISHTLQTQVLQQIEISLLVTTLQFLVVLSILKTQAHNQSLDCIVNHQTHTMRH